ncbi:hypothetical protein Bpfe_006456 [Biomphalaria pfeifferi]|uniref:Uncharacterized protein n=1 Tax=Biomphalaria pfeifferi TaxID=112525 RepID=A0AAD8C0J6_BIOPF|nr:hypothetical protein Bpfe_006456 [Biomphalaria pfeifferi]
MKTTDGYNPHTKTTDGYNPHTKTTDGYTPHTKTTDGYNPHTKTTDGNTQHTKTTDGYNPHTKTTDGYIPHTKTTDGYNPHTKTTDGYNPHTKTTDGYTSKEHFYSQTYTYTPLTFQPTRNKATSPQAHHLQLTKPISSTQQRPTYLLHDFHLIRKKFATTDFKLLNLTCRFTNSTCTD